ncbi:hypothetical protein DMA11_18325 [Marinilabiliaceae bacterium JC017]|nr:hypothetical protein DMA11_18325 [Marinilabiliaceae bacterium JC017]
MSQILLHFWHCPKNEAKRSSPINASAHLLDEFFPTHWPEFPHSFSSRHRRPAYYTGSPASHHYGLVGDLEICIIVTFKKKLRASVPLCFNLDVVPNPTSFLALPQNVNKKV